MNTQKRPAGRRRRDDPESNPSARSLKLTWSRWNAGDVHTTTCSTQVGREWKKGEENNGMARLLLAVAPPPQSYLTLCDMCKGVSISSKMAPFTLEPRRFASCRSQPDRSQFCRTGEKNAGQRSALIGCRFHNYHQMMR